MIYEVPNTAITLPYTDDGRLCLGRGLLSPRCFHAAYKEYPWYPFEDFSFDEREVSSLASLLAKNGQFYRQDMPCRGNDIKIYCIDRPDHLDALKLLNWLCYYEGIIWTDTGSIIINSYSDYVILSMSEELSCEVFGDSIENVFNDSSSTFFDENQNEPTIADFMTEIRETWGKMGSRGTLGP